MKRFFKKHKKLEHGHLRDIAGMCAVAGLLLVAAVFIANGGMGKVNNLLALNHINPGSQTAINWGCSLGFSCDNTTKIVYYILANNTANSITSSSGAAVTLTWTAEAALGGSNTVLGICAPNKSNAGNCSITPTIGTFSPTAATGGTFTVSPTVTTTYTLCSDTGVQNGYGCPTVVVNIASPDNCPATPTAVAGGQQLPPGTYHIVAQGNDFCVTNNSGKYVFVPANSVTEVNNFKSATQGYLSSTVVYFARAAGY
jgi:hypothetical protein